MLRVAHKHGVETSEHPKDTEQDLIDKWKAEFIKRHNAKFKPDNPKVKTTVVQILQRKK